MNPRQEEIDGLAAAIDRVVFHEPEATGAARPAAMALISHLNDSFPRMTVHGSRRERLQRRMIRTLGVPSGESASSLARLEAEMNRRLAAVDPRWRPFMGGAALVLIGVVGVAMWRQRSTVKPAAAAAH
jgi:hypothetical protein